MRAQRWAALPTLVQLGIPEVQFAAVFPEDVEALVSIRISAMRDSLVRAGRFDPDRARERFVSSFSPHHTQFITVAGERVGFVVVKPSEAGMLLDHLYILPEWQGRGIGSAVLQWVFAEADAKQLAVRVGALRGSDSNRFYQRHGFLLVETAEYDNYYVRPSRKAGKPGA